MVSTAAMSSTIETSETPYQILNHFQKKFNVIPLLALHTTISEQATTISKQVQIKPHIWFSILHKTHEIYEIVLILVPKVMIHPKGTLVSGKRSADGTKEGLYSVLI
jgi:hypothetical protein